jgi:hypothetical protein
MVWARPNVSRPGCRPGPDGAILAGLMPRSPRLLLLALLLLPAACGGSAPPPPLSTAPPPLEQSFFPGPPAVVEVILRDPQPVVEAVLIDPDGHALPVGKIAYRRETEESGGGTGPQLRMNAAGGSAGLAGGDVGLALPLLGSPGLPADRVVVSEFSVPIPDPAAYRASWQRWKFHLTLGATKSNRRDIEFLPPRPPG